MTDKRTATITRTYRAVERNAAGIKPRRTATITATAQVGGTYADLNIGGYDGEVIHIGEDDITKRGALRDLLTEWANEQDKEEAEYSETPQNRLWLARYVEEGQY